MLRAVAKNREKLLTVRVSPEVLKDYKIASELKGASMSALIHMFVVHTIREQKERNPESFSKRTNMSERPVVTVKLKRGKVTKQGRR